MLTILHEDNHIIVVVKPQNVPTQADSSKDLDMLTMVREYVREKYNKPGNVYVGLVHRLDRPTGGVMVFAKTSKAAARLTAAIQSGGFEKKYYAVTVNVPHYPANTLINYLKKDEQTNTVRIVPLSEEGARYSELSYHVLASTSQVALCEINLETGRSHQIRVQMQGIGCPVFGDVRYGGDALAKGHNLALWAFELRFLHPVTKTVMAFRAIPPVDTVPWSSFKQIEALFEHLTATEDTVRIALPSIVDDRGR